MDDNPNKFDFNNDNLTDEDKILLAELDAIDISTAEMAVEFTDSDIIMNSELLAQMELKSGHANNVEYNTYTYVINVYKKDAVNGIYMYTRIYEFTDNVSEQLNELFNNFKADFIHRTSTESFASEDDTLTKQIEKRQINVYDLIVPEGFDIDETHYFYNETLMPSSTSTARGWESTLRNDWFDSFDFLNKSMNFDTHELYHLKMTKNTPHVLDTRVCIIKNK